MIGGLQKVTLLDFPGKVACTVFLTGCDLRCPYCHINMPHLLVTSGAVKKEKKLGLPNTKNILIEVKYREGAPIADDDAIVELCEESSAAIIITKNADDYGVHNTKCGKDLLRIPAFAFLYLLGNAEKHGYRGMEQ